MAITRYAGNRMTGVSGDTKPSSNLITGTTFHETNTDDLYIWDGDSWNVVAGDSITQTFANKTLQAPRISLSAVLLEDTTILFEGSTDDNNDTTLTVVDPTANRTVSLPDATGTVSLIAGTETLSNKTYSDHITVAEISAPSTPSSGYGAIYAKSDNKLYFKNDAGTEVDLTNQASGGETNQNAWSTISVSGQDNVVADSATDTLTFVAGSNVTLTTNASNDTVTIATSGSTQNLFQTIAVSGQDNVVADSATDTLTLAASGGMTITTNASNDTITFAASGGSTVTVSDNESTNENNLIAFIADAGTSTGAHALEMDGDLHYNPSTGTLTSTVFVGALTGNVTGNVTGNASGTAATVTGATQSAITTASNLVTVGALDSGSITSGFTSIDVGSGAITTTGTITAGNLTVTGTTTTVNSTNTTIADRLIELASGAGSSTADAGIIVERGSTGDNAIMAWDESSDRFVFGTTTATGASTGDLTIAAGTVQASTFIGNLTGDVTGNTSGSSGSTTGNAATATALATARTIGGTSFDGTANIAVGLAATATALATARTIGGTSFDGSANIAVALSSEATEVTVSANNSTNETVYPTFVDGATGSQGVETDTGLTYNPSTGLLTTATVSTTQVDITAQGDLRLQDTTGGQYVGFQAPGTVSSSVLWTLPSADGSNTHVLQTDGSGTLSWVAPSGGGGTPGGSTNQIQYNSSSSFAGASNVEIRSNTLALKEQSAPSTVSGYGQIYAKTDNQLYYKDDGGTESQLSGNRASNFFGIKAYLNADLNISNNSATVLGDSSGSWTEVYDVGTWHDASTNPDRINFPTIGYYLVNLTHRWGINSTGYREIKAIHHSGGSSSDILLDRLSDVGFTTPYSTSSTVIYASLASDYITVSAYQNSGATLSLEGGTDEDTSITISRLDMASNLTSSSLAKARLSTATTAISNNTETALTFNTDVIDTNAFHDVSSNTHRFVAPSAGYYLVKCKATLDGASGDANYDIRLRIKDGNGVEISEEYTTHGTFDTTYVTVSTSGMVYLAASEWVAGYITHTRDANTNLIGGDQELTFFEIVRIDGNVNQAISDLTDMNITSPADASLLLYDTATSKWIDNVMSGDATLADTGVLTIAAGAVEGTMLNANTVDDSSIQLASNTLNVKAGGVTNAMLAGSIADSNLSTITTGDKVSGSAVQLASTSAIENSTGLRIKAATAGNGLALSSQVLAVNVDDSSIEINSDSLRVKASGVTNAMLANSAITIGGTATSLGGTITALTALTDLDLTAGAKTIFDTVGNANLTIGASDTTVIIAGNLTVSGSTTTVNTATVTVEDPLMALASGNNAADAVDIGFYGLYDTSGSQDLYSGLFRDASDSGKWKLFKDNQSAPTTTVAEGTGYAVATLVANLEGAVSGNATTATVATTVTITDNEATNENNVLVFVAGADADGGNVGLESDGTLHYNPSSGTVTATAFAGNVTGSLTGQVATAAQNTINAIANLATVGTITTGTWQGTTIAVDQGGTGLSSYTGGDIVYASGSTTLAKLAKGTAGQVFKMNSGATAPEWADAAASDQVKLSVTQSSHGFAVGDILRMSGTDDVYAKAQADSAANAEVAGVVITSATNTFELVTSGHVTTAAAVPNQTAGTVLFLDPSTAGAVTATEPSTEGQISKPLAIVTNANDEMIFINFRGKEVGADAITTEKLQSTVSYSSHGLAVGDVVKSSGTNGQYDKAIATSAAGAETVGIVTVVSGNNVTIAWGGIVDVANAVPNVAAGTVLFLSASTSGELTATEPTTAGQISKPFAVITNQNAEMLLLNLRGEVISSAGANAPVGAQYITLAADSTLTVERVLTGGSGITLTDAGAGSTLTVVNDLMTGGSIGGHVLPSAQNTYDLGSGSYQWRNVYTQDFHLNNTLRDTGNSIDGTKGDWTIQEGEEDLFIVNNTTGKKYKFNLTEVA